MSICPKCNCYNRLTEIRKACCIQSNMVVCGGCRHIYKLSTEDQFDLSELEIKPFKMYQSNKESMIESLTNSTIAFLISLGASIVIYPLFDIHIEIVENIGLTLCFTVVALIQGYIVRRCFNKFGKKTKNV